MLSCGVDRTPPEIWIQILACATYEPDEFDTFNTPSWNSNRVMAAPGTKTTVIEDQRPCKPRERRSAMLREKLAYILVSKRWQALALPFLYRRLHLASPDRVSILANALEASIEREGGGGGGDGGGGLGYGRWTRCLLIEGMVLAQPELVHCLRVMKASEAARVVRACPRLEVVLMAVSGINAGAGPPCQLVDALKASPSHIQRVEWLAEMPDATELLHFVTLAPKLRHLKLSTYAYGGASLPLDELSDVHASDLETLEMDFPRSAGSRFPVHIVTQWALPSIRSVSLTCSGLRHNDILAFFSVHGSKLTRLRFRESRLGYTKDLLPRILVLCPDLRELTFKGACFQGLSLLEPCTSVVWMAIGSTRVEETGVQLEHVLTPSKWPNLKTIRLHAWTLGVARSQSEPVSRLRELIGDAKELRGIQFEGAEGRSL